MTTLIFFFHVCIFIIHVCLLRNLLLLVITLLSRDNDFNEFLLLLRILLPWWLKSWAEVHAIDFINHSHWTFTPLRCSRVLPTTHLQRRLNVISASVHRVLAGESSWCLTVVFNDPALVFEYQLRHRFSSREVGLRVFEFAVQVVELQQEEVVLLEVEIFSWLQIDGHVVLYC